MEQINYSECFQIRTRLRTNCKEIIIEVVAFYQTRCRASIGAIFSRRNILQGSVAPPFRCGGKFNDSFVADFLPNVSVK